MKSSRRYIFNELIFSNSNYDSTFSHSLLTSRCIWSCPSCCSCSHAGCKVAPCPKGSAASESASPVSGSCPDSRCGRTRIRIEGPRPPVSGFPRYRVPFGAACSWLSTRPAAAVQNRCFTSKTRDLLLQNGHRTTENIVFKASPVI